MSTLHFTWRLIGTQCNRCNTKGQSEQPSTLHFEPGKAGSNQQVTYRFKLGLLINSDGNRKALSTCHFLIGSLKHWLLFAPYIQTFFIICLYLYTLVNHLLASSSYPSGLCPVKKVTLHHHQDSDPSSIPPLHSTSPESSQASEFLMQSGSDIP